MSKYNLKQRKEIKRLIIEIAKQTVTIERPINYTEISKELKEKHNIDLTPYYVNTFIKNNNIR